MSRSMSQCECTRAAWYVGGRTGGKRGEGEREGGREESERENELEEGVIDRLTC